MNPNRFSHRITLFACILAFVVVMLGAYTRLTDAGLGCLDWPGCYGHVVVPDTAHKIQQAEIAFPGDPIHQTKAWTEMVHRYIAGSVGLIILSVFGIALFKRKRTNHPLGLPIALMILLFFQAALGMWTVTLKLLPVIVMGHLLGGMTLLSLLWALQLRLGGFFKSNDLSLVKSYRPWALLGLIVVFLQIALGAWVSSNYAALICPTFPFCSGSLIPNMNFHDAFNLLAPIGIDYQGGVLGTTARVTIQMVHRYGAFITGVYIGGLSIYLISSAKTKFLRVIAWHILFFLCLQITLGVLNIEWLLPLPIAVAHNGVAALLLLSLVTLNYSVFKKPLSKQEVFA